jgi:hypothetical protein
MSKVQSICIVMQVYLISLFLFFFLIFDFCLLMQLATLTGHTFRVLYLAISPDGQVVSPLLCYDVLGSLLGSPNPPSILVLFLFLF